MAKRKAKSRRHAKSAPHNHRHSNETRAGDATTVAWIVSTTMVLLCDVAAVAAHFYTQANPSAGRIAMLKELMLFAGAVIGFISLAMLPIVLRVRRVPPPSGVTAFAVCAAAAPILALIVRNMR